MKAGNSESSPTDAWLQRLYLLLGMVGLALLLRLAWLLFSPSAAPQLAPQRIDHVERCAEAAVPLEHRREPLRQLLARPLPADPGCWMPFRLPSSDLGDEGPALHASPVARSVYRWRYLVPEGWPSGDALTVYGPRVSGLAWMLTIDGHHVADNLDDWRMTWIRPVAATLPRAAVMTGQVIQMDLAVAYVPASGFAIAPFDVGPASALAAEMKWRDLLQFTMPQACSIVLLLLGGFFFGFWWMRRQERAHLLIGLASVAWSVSNLQYVLTRHDDPAIERWYNGIVIAAVVWFMWLVYLFALSFYPRRLLWAEWLLPVYVLGMSILALPTFELLDDEGLVFLICNDLVAAAVTVLIITLAVRQDGIELRVVAVTLLVALAAGTHDIALLAGHAPPQNIYLLPYTGVLIFGAFLYTAQRRYVLAINDHEALSQSLAQRLADREAHLLENHQRLRELERSQTLANERQRLMRDMHDGLGSTLTSSLVALERGELQPARVAEMLRDCVDELRMVIDSLAPDEQDLPAVLASLRFRMERRLADARIRLAWDIEDVPALSWLGPSEIVHVLRILQEALVNVIKHANASTVRISLKQVDQGVEVRCADDGCGFDVRLDGRGRGMRSISQRCELLGAALQIRPLPSGGSEVLVCLPFDRVDHRNRVVS